MICKVTAVKLERLEVKISVGYPKTDGPESFKEVSLASRMGGSTRMGGDSCGLD